MANLKKSIEEKQLLHPIYIENWIWAKVKEIAALKKTTASATIRKAILKSFEDK